MFIFGSVLITNVTFGPLKILLKVVCGRTSKD